MRLFGPTLPAEVAAQVEGRVLAAAEAADGTWLVGTRSELVLVAGPGEAAGAGGLRIPWEQVEDVDWDRDASVLRVREVGRFGEPRPTYTVTMPELEPGALLQLIRERVMASIVLQRGHIVSGKRGFKVVARRSPAGGPISWMVEYDDGVDPTDPAVLEAAEGLLRRAREDVGEQPSEDA
jgi:hypothetical protein